MSVEHFSGKKNELQLDKKKKVGGRKCGLMWLLERKGRRYRGI